MRDKVQNRLYNESMLSDTQAGSEAVRSLVIDLACRYHSQAIDQAKYLFLFSLAVAVLGIFLLGYTVITIDNDNHLLVVTKSLSGTTIELVAGLFFRQARELRERATALFDRLRLDKRQMDIALLVKSIEDREVRDIVKAYVALQLVDSHEEK